MSGDQNAELEIEEQLTTEPEVNSETNKNGSEYPNSAQVNQPQPTDDVVKSSIRKSGPSENEETDKRKNIGFTEPNEEEESHPFIVHTDSKDDDGTKTGQEDVASPKEINATTDGETTPKADKDSDETKRTSIANLDDENISEIPAKPTKTKRRKKQLSIDLISDDMDSEEGLNEEEEEEVEEEAVEEEEEECEEEEIVEEEVLFDRIGMTEIYYGLKATRTNLKKINNFSQRKMAEYFKEMNLEHVLHDVNPDLKEELEAKYKETLHDYDEIKTEVIEAREYWQQCLDDLRTQLTEGINKFDFEFEKYTRREKELGIGLISSNTGTAMPDKVVERYVKRQHEKLLQQADSRLLFIKIKNKLANQIAAYHAVESVAPGLTLHDYDHLSILNTSLTDKIEERDAELDILREKCNNVAQKLAHFREKTFATEHDIANSKLDLKIANEIIAEKRTRISDAHVKRNNIRGKIYRLTLKSGILFKKDLLDDMEESLDKKQNLDSSLAELKSAFEIDDRKIREIRYTNKKVPPNSINGDDNDKCR